MATAGWVRVLKAAKNAYKAVDKTNDLRGRIQGADKLTRSVDPKNSEKAIREIMGIESPLADAIDALSEARDDLTQVRNSKVEWAECDGGDLFMAGAAAADKHGKDSKQAKAAWAAYAKHLQRFHDEIAEEVDALEQMQAMLPARKKAVGQVIKIAESLDKGFQMLLKLPVPLPSAAQAQIFTLSEDAGLLLTQAGNVETLLREIEKRVEAEIKEGEAIMTANLKWLAWAAKASGLDLQAIQRNARAKLPR